MKLIESYEFSLKMGWKIIVLSNNNEEALLKLEEYLKKLYLEPGFTSKCYQAIENIKNKEYTVQECESIIVL